MGALAGVALLFCWVHHLQDEISELELDGLIEIVLY